MSIFLCEDYCSEPPRFSSGKAPKFRELTTTLRDLYRDSPEKIEKYISLHRLVAVNKGMTPEEARQISPEQIQVTYFKRIEAPVAKVASGLLELVKAATEINK